MNKLLKSIYENEIYGEKDTQEMEKCLEKEIRRLLKPYSGQFNKDELEIITGLMYAAQLKSTQEGF